MATDLIFRMAIVVSSEILDKSDVVTIRIAQAESAVVFRHFLDLSRGSPDAEEIKSQLFNIGGFKSHFFQEGPADRLARHVHINPLAAVYAQATPAGTFAQGHPSSESELLDVKLCASARILNIDGYAPYAPDRRTRRFL